MFLQSTILLSCHLLLWYTLLVSPIELNESLILELFNYILKVFGSIPQVERYTLLVYNSDEWNTDANIYTVIWSHYFSVVLLATSAHSCVCTGLAFYSTGYTSLPLGLQYQCSLQRPNALQQPSPSLHLRREMEASAQTSVDSCQQTGEMNFSWRQQV